MQKYHSKSWTKDTIFSKKKYEQNFFLKDDYRRRKDYTLEKIVDKFSFSEKQLFEVYKYSKKLKIDFTSTPFSKKEVNEILSDEIYKKLLKDNLL